jgi:sulfopyruvate decarboxylase TPP-binding subunit
MNKFVVGVPCSKLKDKVDYNKAIIATREDEALSMAVGASLMGKETQVFMQNSGLNNALDVITSLLKPYNISIPLLISLRTKPEHHSFMGKVTIKLLELLDYKNYEIVEEK